MSVLPIEDYRIKITPTTELGTFLKVKLNGTKDWPENIIRIVTSGESEVKTCALLIEDIKWLNTKLIEYRNATGEKVYLNQLLSKSNVILAEPKVVPRCPKLDARVKKLIEQEKNREYALMTKNVDSVRKFYPEDTIAYQMKQINKQLIAVAQFVFSVITGFAFGFIGIELIVGNLDFGFRLLLGIMFALIVALAEIYFLAKKLSEDYTYEMSTSATYTKIHQD